MKSLKKCQLMELKAEMPMLDKQELETIVGGIFWRLDLQGHLISTIDDGAANDTVEINGNRYIVSGHLKYGYAISPGSCCGSGSSSGVCFEGPGVTSGFFMFLSTNTDVEWMYAFNSGQAGGYVVSSNEVDNVREQVIPAGFESTVHNHNHERMEYMESVEDWMEYNNLPSNQDINDLIQSNRKYDYIFNEINCSWHRFDANSQTQEEFARAHNWPI